MSELSKVGKELGDLLFRFLNARANMAKHIMKNTKDLSRFLCVLSVSFSVLMSSSFSEERKALLMEFGRQEEILKTFAWFEDKFGIDDNLSGRGSDDPTILMCKEYIPKLQDLLEKRNQLLKEARNELVSFDLLQENPFWTFLLCIQRLGLSKRLKHLIPVIYRDYVVARFGMFDLEGKCKPLYRLTQPGKMWHGSDLQDLNFKMISGSEKAKCLDELCGHSVTLYDAPSLSAYLKWINGHFRTYHNKSFQTYYDFFQRCLHENVERVVREEVCHIDWYDVEYEICKACGKLTKAET